MCTKFVKCEISAKDLQSLLRGAYMIIVEKLFGNFCMA